jgi:diguanylate cyclase (GGDEF)-like protein
MLTTERRLIPVISVLLVVGFFATSLASFFASRASLRRQISEHELPLTSDNIYSEIQRDLLRPILISSLMANDTFLRDWVIQGEQDESRVRNYLREIQTKYGTFTSFFVSERTSIYYHSDGILKKVSPTEWRDVWYYRVRTMKDPYEVNVDPDMANKDAMTIFINYRVFDYSGNYIGATGVGLTVDAVKRQIENYQARYGRQIYFVDRAGEVRLHGSQFPAGVKSLADIDGLNAVAKEVLSRPAGAYTYRRNGATVHLNTRHIGEFGWYLMVEQAEDKALKEIVRTLFVNLGICGVIVAVVLLLTTVTVRSYQETIEKMAITDKLTGAYNRRAFDLLCHETLRDAQRNRSEVSVIMLDVDRFKRVNDRFGHAAGDLVLQNLVQTMSAGVRASDMLCRWGGEEFLVLLRRCPLEEAAQVAEKLRAQIERSSTDFGGKPIAITVSLGAAQYRPGEDEDSLLKRVDAALYEAKRKGRNRVESEQSPAAASPPARCCPPRPAHREPR